MTFGDLFTNLFLLLIVSLPALIVALVHEKNRRSSHPGENQDPASKYDAESPGDS
jgi:hypothetical protein